ncbi:MAG: UDP-galactopyranose mutase [Bacilli bacterium]|nr:UDP-galactopyranose mutase [Bacilli bacterium]
MNINNYDAVIIGAGFAGATIANCLANANKKVLIIDKRNHIGGNAYDYFNNDGIIIHQYGPHIFHTSNKEVWDYLQKFSGFFPYEHRVLGNIDGVLVPIPFNFKSLELTHQKEEAETIKQLLKQNFPNKKRISILDLINHSNPTLKAFGDFVYQKVFVYYTSKQWGIHPSQIDQSVINRVPVILGYEDTYFADTYQFMPNKGYTEIFNNMLNHPNIDIKLNTNIKDHIEFKDAIYIDKEKFNGHFIYTGAIDELFNYQFGVLPYRSLDIVLEKHNLTHYQPVATVNYPTSEKFTRISEYKYFLNQDIKDKTVIAKEYSKAYSLESKTDPYYPINNEANLALYKKYEQLAQKYHIYLCGRLAEYKYYNMDAVIARALTLASKLK